MTQVDELLTFLREAVTPFHAVQAMSRRLADAGFEAVESFDPDIMVPGSGYFMTRQGSSLIALRAGQGEPAQGLRLVGAQAKSCLLENSLFLNRPD